MKERLSQLAAEYGGIFVGVYLVLFVGSITGFAAAIKAGYQVEGAAAEAGVWGAAYLATKALQPVRIGVAAVVTPLLGRLWGRAAAAPVAVRADEPAASGAEED